MAIFRKNYNSKERNFMCFVYIQGQGWGQIHCKVLKYRHKYYFPNHEYKYKCFSLNILKYNHFENTLDTYELLNAKQFEQLKK